MSQRTSRTLSKRPIALLLSVWLAVFILTSAQAGVKIGQSDLSLSSEVQATYSFYSNFFYRDPALEPILPVESSFVSIIDPSLILSAGDADSKFLLSWKTGAQLMDIQVIDDADQAELHSRLSASFDGTRSNWSALASYAESSLPSPDSYSNTGLTPRTNESASWNGSIRLSSRTRLKGGLSYSADSYEDNILRNYNDSEVISIPVSLLYGLRDNIEIGGGLRWRQLDYELGGDRNDLAWHFSAETAPSSRLNLDAKMGWLNSTFENASGGSQSGLFVSTNATWTATEHTKIFINLSKDNNPSSIASSIDREKLTLGMNWALTQKIGSTLTASFENEDYGGSSRKDSSEALSCVLTYSPYERVSFFVNFNYLNNNSNLFGRDYESLSLSTSARIKF